MSALHVQHMPTCRRNNRSRSSPTATCTCPLQCRLLAGCEGGPGPIVSPSHTGDGSVSDGAQSQPFRSRGARCAHRLAALLPRLVQRAPRAHPCAPLRPVPSHLTGFHPAARPTHGRRPHAAPDSCARGQHKSARFPETRDLCLAHPLSLVRVYVTCGPSDSSSSVAQGRRKGGTSGDRPANLPQALWLQVCGEQV